MKKALLVVLAALCTLVANAQEKTEKQIVLKNGIALTGVVEVQPDGSYRVEVASGDVFYFTSAEVSKVTDSKGKIVFKKQESEQGVHNYIPTESSVFVRRGKLYSSVTGEALTQNDFASLGEWEKYQRGRNTRKTGNALLWSGVGVSVAGVAGFVWFGNFAWSEHLSIGVGSAGIALVTAGIIVKVIGNKQIKLIANNYNQRPGYALDFGAQQYGVGFALKF